MKTIGVLPRACPAICASAPDFCVYYSAMDAHQLGFEAVVVEAGCRAIDLAGSLYAAWTAMATAGVQRVNDLAAN